MTDAAPKLARMANQIAAFFRSYPEEEAVKGVHGHIKSFWSPRMRLDLAARLDDPDLPVDPLVRAAFAMDPELGTPRLPASTR
ncbi:formate dehydrogenase subunit delta [Enterovirga rhinocerotis]|uniref:Formate dehydrogenase subunit delta n=1 Tax=Enterovirga rhinocerotis TaxID=1339210 RepID=A0A4R7BUN3_9HYPH|nr:formate dehydrogenase subunit delta [Enterovirga rhinocerotis]TDR89211.1 formate dehydrogenase subunit delta [Enterovirga rhinocerotis]